MLSSSFFDSSAPYRLRVNRFDPLMCLSGCFNWGAPLCWELCYFETVELSYMLPKNVTIMGSLILICTGDLPSESSIIFGGVQVLEFLILFLLNVLCTLSGSGSSTPPLLLSSWKLQEAELVLFLTTFSNLSCRLSAALYDILFDAANKL